VIVGRGPIQDYLGQLLRRR